MLLHRFLILSVVIVTTLVTSAIQFTLQWLTVKPSVQQHSYTHIQAPVATFVIISNASQLHDIRVSPRPASAASQLRDRWQECGLTVSQWKDFSRSEHVLSVVNLVRALPKPQRFITLSPLSDNKLLV